MLDEPLMAEIDGARKRKVSLGLFAESIRQLTFSRRTRTTRRVKAQWPPLSTLETARTWAPRRRLPPSPSSLAISLLHPR